MRKTILVLFLVGAIVIAGCSSSTLTTPGERAAQAVMSGITPALAFQLNAACFVDPEPTDIFIPLYVPLGELGLTAEDVISVMIGASLVNGVCPYDLDIPEWDEWLLVTFFDLDIPEWDEWLLATFFDLDIPEWDEWLYGLHTSTIPLDLDIPEWDEWLLRFEAMDQYRSIDWMDWAINGPAPLDLDIPEWDEWLLSLTLGEMAESYDAWWKPRMHVITF